MSEPARVIPKTSENLSEYFRLEYGLNEPDADRQSAKMKAFFAAAMKPTNENGKRPTKTA